MTRVCFLAVSYFGSTDVASYVKSLQEQSDERWILKIVDNSQDKDEQERLLDIAGSDGRIEVWETGGNLGYFGAAEWARTRIAEEEFDWIAVTNTDVVFTSADFVSNLLVSPAAKTAAVVAPAIYGSRSKSSLNPYMYGRPTLSRSRLRRILFWNTSTAQATVLLSELRRLVAKSKLAPLAAAEIYAAHGSFMIFGRQFFEVGGTFQHSSFLFGEELTVAEFCRSKGLRTVFVPDLTVQHTEHANTGIFRSELVLKAQVEASKRALKLIAATD